MRKLNFAVALALLAVVAWFGLQGNSPRAAIPPAGAQKFEYKQTNWGGENERSLNDLGAQGWEMCGVIPEQHVVGNTVVIFKRPKQ